MKNKKSLLILSSCLAVTLCSAVAYTTVSAEIGVKTQPTTLALESGARVKFGTEEGGNGLRYTLQMDKSEYAKFMGSGYTDVTFGVLIAPEFYQTKYGAFDEANVFGIGENAQAIYDWATWGDTDGDGENSWEYSGTLTRIINLSTTELVEFTKESTTLVQYKGSIVDLDVASITGEFRGVGYVTYKDEGELKCKMVTGDNVRTMAYVANEAIKGYQDDLLNDELTEDEIKAINDKISLLNTNYMTKISDVEYKVNHHYVNVDGTETVDTEDLSAKATTLIEVAPKASEYFTYDKDNEDNVLKGIAKTGVEFDVYYTQNTKALTDAALLLDVDSTTSLTIPESVSTSVTNALIGGVSVWSALDGTTLTLSNVDKLAPNGLTTITYVTDTYAYTQEIDVYTLNNFDGENFLAEGTTIVGNSLWSNYDGCIVTTTEAEWEGETNVYKVSADAVDVFAAAVKPRHTSAVYSLFNTKYSTQGIYLSYRIWIEDVDGDWSTRKVNDLGGGQFGNLNVGRWYTINMNLGGANHNMASTGFDRFTRLDEMHYKYSLAEKGEKIDGNDYIQRYEKDTAETFYQRGFLVYLSQVKSTGVYRKTNVYVTEPTIKVGGTTGYGDTNNGKLIDFVGEGHNYADFVVSEITVDGTVTTPTEKISLADYPIPQMKTGNHTVKVRIVNNNNYAAYEPKQNITVFNGTILAYNTALGVEYTTVDASRVDNSVYLASYGTKQGGKVSVVTSDNVPTEEGYTPNGNYYKAVWTSSSDAQIVAKPMHSKEYYEYMRTLGYTAITFDFYVADDVGNNSISCTGTNLIVKGDKEGQWLTASISLDLIIEYYQVTTKNAGGSTFIGGFNGGQAIFYEDGTSTYNYSGLLKCNWVSPRDLTIYVGNFGCVKA